MGRCYIVGVCEVRPDERRVLVGGKPAVLGARAFDLLTCLIEHRDRVVTKNELMELVWAGSAVEENNLTVHVSALRKLPARAAIWSMSIGSVLCARLSVESGSARATAAGTASIVRR